MNLGNLGNRLPSACRRNAQAPTTEEDDISCADPFSEITIIEQNNDGSCVEAGCESNNESYNETETERSGNGVSDESIVMVTHIIVLIHGWMGNPAEMGYIKESIQNAANKNVASCDDNNYDNVKHRFVIHSAACNEHRTDDGIAVGGSRMAQEINDLVRYIVDGGPFGTTNDNDNDSHNHSHNHNHNHNNNNNDSHNDDHNDNDIHNHNHNDNGVSAEEKKTSLFTLSIIGNSLGGLYARYALAGIDWTIGDKSSSSSASASASSSSPRTTSTLLPMIFLTTATPHLGISQHTYIPLPRAAEFVVAQGMKQTGRDFFRFTPVLEDMFHKDYFVVPLSKFQQRIAYINVYGTDFQVPTATAAFWAPGSDSVHYRVPTVPILSENDCIDTDNDNNNNNDKDKDSDNNNPNSASEVVSELPSSSVPKAIVMILSTPQRPDLLGEEEDKSEELDDTEEIKCGKPQDNKDRAKVYRAWSKRFDGLGWTKVLVDVREDVPTVPVPVKSSDETASNENKSDEDCNTNGSSESDEEKDATDNNSITADNTNIEDADADTGIDLTSKNTWTAAELLAEFQGGLLKAGGNGKNPKGRGSLWDLKPRIPLGHTVMIANAKDEFNKKVTRGGKPVMDYLGVSMVQTLTSTAYSTDQHKM